MIHASKHWRHMGITIFCDNYSVVQVIMSGETKDPFLALCIRNIWLLKAYNDIDLMVRHIPGINTIADTLSYHCSEFKATLLNVAS